MPGPSYAPIIASVGLFFLFLGLALGGPFLAIGVVFLVLALLYWGREAMGEYDHAADPPRDLAPAIVRSPPPGVHMPGPSFRPILASIALMVLFYGLVFGGPLLVAGFLMLVVSLLAWLKDARHEYGDVLVADATGHMPPASRPGYPRGIIATFVVLLVGGLVLQSGLLPLRSAVGGAGASPSASGAPSSPGPGGPDGSGQPPGPPGSGGPGGPAGGDVVITAVNIAFNTASIDAPAGRAFTIHFVNDDAGIPHNVAIHSESATGPEVFRGEIFPGVAERTYDVPALQPGTYGFVCTVHPNMTGNLTAR